MNHHLPGTFLGTVSVSVHSVILKNPYKLVAIIPIIFFLETEPLFKLATKIHQLASQDWTPVCLTSGVLSSYGTALLLAEKPFLRLDGDHRDCCSASWAGVPGAEGVKGRRMLLEKKQRNGIQNEDYYFYGKEKRSNVFHYKSATEDQQRK